MTSQKHANVLYYLNKSVDGSLSPDDWRTLANQDIKKPGGWYPQGSFRWPDWAGQGVAFELQKLAKERAALIERLQQVDEAMNACSAEIQQNTMNKYDDGVRILADRYEQDREGHTRRSLY